MSLLLTLTVPSCCIDKPAAIFASSQDFFNVLFEAKEAARTDITVSPAPVTSYTSLRDVGKVKTESLVNNTIPFLPRVKSNVSNCRSFFSFFPFAIMSFLFLNVL